MVMLTGEQRQAVEQSLRGQVFDLTNTAPTAFGATTNRSGVPLQVRQYLQECAPSGSGYVFQAQELARRLNDLGDRLRTHNPSGLSQSGQLAYNSLIGDPYAQSTINAAIRPLYQHLDDLNYPRIPSQYNPGSGTPVERPISSPPASVAAVALAQAQTADEYVGHMRAIANRYMIRLAPNDTAESAYSLTRSHLGELQSSLEEIQQRTIRPPGQNTPLGHLLASHDGNVRASIVELRAEIDVLDHDYQAFRERMTVDQLAGYGDSRIVPNARTYLPNDVRILLDRHDGNVPVALTDARTYLSTIEGERQNLIAQLDQARGTFRPSAPAAPMSDNERFSRRFQATLEADRTAAAMSVMQPITAPSFSRGLRGAVVSDSYAIQGELRRHGYSDEQANSVRLALVSLFDSNPETFTRNWIDNTHPLAPRQAMIAAGLSRDGTPNPRGLIDHLLSLEEHVTPEHVGNPDLNNALALLAPLRGGAVATAQVQTHQQVAQELSVIGGELVHNHGYSEQQSNAIRAALLSLYDLANNADRPQVINVINRLHSMSLIVPENRTPNLQNMRTLLLYSESHALRGANALAPNSHVPAVNDALALLVPSNQTSALAAAQPATRDQRVNNMTLNDLANLTNSQLSQPGVVTSIYASLDSLYAPDGTIRSNLPSETQIRALAALSSLRVQLADTTLRMVGRQDLLNQVNDTLRDIAPSAIPLAIDHLALLPPEQFGQAGMISRIYAILDSFYASDNHNLRPEVDQQMLLAAVVALRQVAESARRSVFGASDLISRLDETANSLRPRSSEAPTAIASAPLIRAQPQQAPIDPATINLQNLGSLTTEQLGQTGVVPRIFNIINSLYVTDEGNVIRPGVNRPAVMEALARVRPAVSDARLSNLLAQIDATFRDLVELTPSAPTVVAVPSSISAPRATINVTSPLVVSWASLDSILNDPERLRAQFRLPETRANISEFIRALYVSGELARLQPNTDEGRRQLAILGELGHFMQSVPGLDSLTERVVRASHEAGNSNAIGVTLASYQRAISATRPAAAPANALSDSEYAALNESMLGIERGTLGPLDRGLNVQSRRTAANQGATRISDATAQLTELTTGTDSLTGSILSARITALSAFTRRHTGSQYRELISRAQTEINQLQARKRNEARATSQGQELARASALLIQQQRRLETLTPSSPRFVASAGAIERELSALRRSHRGSDIELQANADLVTLNGLRLQREINQLPATATPTDLTRLEGRIHSLPDDKQGVLFAALNTHRPLATTSTPPAAVATSPTLSPERVNWINAGRLTADQLGQSGFSDRIYALINSLYTNNDPINGHIILSRIGDVQVLAVLATMRSRTSDSNLLASINDAITDMTPAVQPSGAGRRENVPPTSAPAAVQETTTSAPAPVAARSAPTAATIATAPPVSEVAPPGSTRRRRGSSTEVTQPPVRNLTPEEQRLLRETANQGNVVSGVTARLATIRPAAGQPTFDAASVTASLETAFQVNHRNRLGRFDGIIDRTIFNALQPSLLGAIQSGISQDTLVQMITDRHSQGGFIQTRDYQTVIAGAISTTLEHSLAVGTDDHISRTTFNRISLQLVSAVLSGTNLGDLLNALRSTAGYPADSADYPTTIIQITSSR